MKHLKIWITACLALAAAGCSDDDLAINSAQTTVQFKDASVSVKETASYIDLPILIAGDNRDGYVEIEVAVKSNPADFDPDKDIIVTTYHFLIDPDMESINLEVGLNVETHLVEKGRNISFEIARVHGGIVGTNSTCTLHFIERNYPEGLYTISGQNPLQEMSLINALAEIYAADDTYDNMYLHLYFGKSARIHFTEVVADEIYDVVIDPLQEIGMDDDGNRLYLSWAKLNERTGILEYDPAGEKPIKGRWVRSVFGNRETVVITFEDGFGVYSPDIDGHYSFVWKEGATMTMN